MQTCWNKKVFYWRAEHICRGSVVSCIKTITVITLVAGIVYEKTWTAILFINGCVSVPCLSALYNTHENKTRQAHSQQPTFLVLF